MPERPPVPDAPADRIRIKRIYRAARVSDGVEVVGGRDLDAFQAPQQAGGGVTPNDQVVFQVAQIGNAGERPAHPGRILEAARVTAGLFYPELPPTDGDHAVEWLHFINSGSNDDFIECSC